MLIPLIIIGNQSQIRWFELDVSEWPNVKFIQDARLSRPDTYFLFPAIAVDTNHNMGLIFGQSSSTEYASLWVTGRLASDPINTLRPPILLHQSNVSLDYSESTIILSNRNYGGFFGATVDPNGGFWMAGEYVFSINRWSTWIGHIGLPEN